MTPRTNRHYALKDDSVRVGKILMAGVHIYGQRFLYTSEEMRRYLVANKVTAPRQERAKT